MMVGKEAEMEAEGYKIWKNPGAWNESPLYLGEFYPPHGQACFFNIDLKDLGFAPGEYTVRIPDSLRKVYALNEWQKISVIE
jgi:hypothetical protein